MGELKRYAKKITAMNAQENNTSRIFDTVFVACLTIVAVAIPVFLVKRYWFSSFSPSSTWQIVAGGIIAALVILLFSYNIYTSFLRPWIHQRRFGSLDDYQYVSGAPGLGSLLVPVAALLLPNFTWIGVVLLAIYLLDTGGIHIAAAVFLRDCCSSQTKQA